MLLSIFVVYFFNPCSLCMSTFRLSIQSYLVYNVVQDCITWSDCKRFSFCDAVYFTKRLGQAIFLTPRFIV